MENKTAVEWLKEQLESIARTSVEWHEVFYEAIELEKQQITKAVNETQVRCIKTANSILKKGFGMDDMFEFDFDMAEQYYKDNYKKHKE